MRNSRLESHILVDGYPWDHLDELILVAGPKPLLTLSLIVIIDWRIVLGDSEIKPYQRQSLLTLSHLLLLGRCTWQRQIWSRPFSQPRRQYSRTTARKGKCTKPEKVSNFKLFVNGKTQLSDLWWMPNSVNKSFGKAMKTGWSRRFKRYPTTYAVCKFQVGFPLLLILRLVLVYPNP